MSENKRTCLYDRHVALGALISPFGGFEMPIQYEGITEEHNAVRTDCGVFDVSHMGEVNISGPDAERFVNHIFTNDITAAPDGKIFYGMMLRPDGGTVDDLCDSLGELAIQGPKSEEVMEQVLGISCADLTFYTFRESTLDGHHILVSRTGYTGEDGFEIYADHDTIRSLWDTLIDSGRCKPCGLGCRDTLRFEVGLPLYGDELAEDITPIEASLSIFVKTDKPEFIGREAIIAQKEAGPARKLVGLEIHDRAIPRHGYEVLTPEGEVVGTVTTGYRGISVDKSIAMALVDSRYAAKDTPLAVRIRRKVFPATVVPRKFYKKSYKK